MTDCTGRSPECQQRFETTTALRAFDLYRPDTPEAWIIDFKTHQIGADKVEKAAEDYRIQAEIYRAAAGIVRPTRMKLHFTHPGVALELA